MSGGERRRRRKDDKEAHEKLKKRISSVNRSTDNPCSICLNGIRDLSFADCCLHPFCRSCIIEWSKRSNHCPVCRTIFDNIITNIISDEEFEQIPIEPPPIINTIPLINIVRDIMVSQDGRSTLIRTRIINDDRTTEITESRENESTSTGENDTSAQSPNQSNNPGSPRDQINVEIEEFVNMLFRSLVIPDQPFSAVAFIEDPTSLPRPKTQSRFPRPFFPPPLLNPYPRPYMRTIHGKNVRYPKFEWTKSTINGPRGRSGIFRFPVRNVGLPSFTRPRNPSPRNPPPNNPPPENQRTDPDEESNERRRRKNARSNEESSKK